MKKILVIFCSAVFYTSFIQAQSIVSPNYALKTPETLNINRIELTPEKTVIYLTVENERKDGYYCADKNIFIVYPDGKKSKLISSSGIPVCPDTHKFSRIGEKLDFKLTFPVLKSGTQSIDLVESCSDNCFSFYSICLNSDLNKQIDEATVLAENKETAKALASLIKIAGSVEGKNSGMDGLLYMNIVRLAADTGNNSKAEEWYKKLKSSGIPHLQLYIEHLNSDGIIF